jgi:hypothetical protein
MTTTTVPDLQSLALLLSERHDQLADQLDSGDGHERALLMILTGLLHQSAMSIYALRDYRRGKENQE